jgi:hypothetical protein
MPSFSYYSFVEQFDLHKNSYYLLGIAKPVKG